MAKYQKYAEYKDSGVEWLGEIPKHWINTRFKFCCDRVVVGIAEAATHAYADEGVPILRSTNIRETGLDTKNLIYIKQIFADQNDSKYLYANDIITVRTGYPGISSVVPIELDKSQCFTNLISTPNKKFNPNFLTFFFNSDIGKRYFELLGWGSAQKNISVPILQNFFLATPDILEQHLIVDFLDHETAQIDSLIAKQEKLIELLKEKRQAVISHAVTKGLNPDVSMKDSGVEWLGQVPEHWEVGRLKNVLAIKNGRDYKNVEVEEGGYPVYGSGGIFKRSSDYLYDGISILFGRKGTIDKPLLVNGRFWTVDTMFYSELAKNIHPEYVYFQSLGFPFDKLSTNTALPSMTQEDLLNLGFAIPPIEEQIAISKFIAEYLEKNHSLMEKAKSAIQLMQERRTALISSAVTGKIDVRNWQHPNEEKKGLIS